HSGGRIALLILILSVILTSSFLAGDLSYMLRTSIIGYPEHEPFDGTVYPIQQVPNWMAMDLDEWDYSFGSMNSGDFVSIPNYDPNQLKISADTLEWGDASDDIIRNAKITYPVPYMGNYLLDGYENAGSHPAVDIKVPSGTPVYSMANGTVIKAVNQTSGFGNHIVVQHNNFPSLDDPNANETLFSSYSHLGSLLVGEGDVVGKGEKIALSGDSGTATTPHLHFQIDNDSAPWHPYWPFSWQEASDAGLDFFSAVNAGLGQSNALSTTVNSMKYVQEYLDGSVAPDVSVDTVVDSYVPEDVEVEEVVVEVVEEEIVEDPPVLQFDYAVSSAYYEEQGGEFTVLLRDQFDNVYKDGFEGEIIIKSDNGLFTTKPSIVRNIDFGNVGNLIGDFSRLDAGKDRIVIEYNGETYYSNWFDIVKNEVSVVFTDLPEDNEYYLAVNYLVNENVVAGYPDGTFKPDQTVSRVEAIKFIFEGLQQEVMAGNLPFSDTDKSQWYGGYLYTAYNKGVVNGYSDGTFKPMNTVNKAEFYKILFSEMGVDVNPDVAKNPYNDVLKTEWYAPYIAYAKDLGIIDSNVKYLEPDNGMSRGEVAYAIYKLMQVMK
ncbi:MAG: peptidoglycan DD-metalloendopeptidase family protein, partial [Nitrospirae bacterium]|nr:peptidoglycan DD-metalloendopeptidase family protein [Nitrospirota bacterium]